MTCFKLLAVVFLACVSVHAQLRELGSLTLTNSIGWDPVTNASIYRVWVGETNLTGFAQVATVTTNRYFGHAASTLNGWKAVFVTAVNVNGESSSSERVLVRFAAGIPQPPRNLQFYSVLIAAATNGLPPIAPPPPIPTP